MKPLLTRVFTAAVTLFALSASAEDGKLCNSTSRECEQQIRQMVSGRRYLGVQLVELPPGITVKSVVPNSPASRAHLLAGDRLIAVNGRSIVGGKVQDFKKILADAKATGTLWMIVQRRGAYRKIEVRLEPYSKDQIDKIVAGHLLQFHQAQAATQH